MWNRRLSPLNPGPSDLWSIEAGFASGPSDPTQLCRVQNSVNVCLKSIPEIRAGKINRCIVNREIITVSERAQRAATSENTNRKSTSKSRTHFHNFDSRWYKCSQHKQIKKRCKCSQHNQIHFICSAFLCLVVLLCVCCQIDESVFLICTCFFLFAARFFFGLCCEHLQRVCCQIEEVVFLICMCFLNLHRVELSRPP